ncbi:TRAP dicarboxylate transporter, DctM subunit, unknown substrate 3 [Candidatus Rhodobacter oscarellae]|uniref:TRAP transporter large permease protein n=1 Tax=Candidatus Rhodobacter oscarellae TaxID=1675527 RepID=A0A0J9ED28_9RHOB|nr:TRAP transporter large permease [Candidatus Rhodobacter lobularis]KMW59624.1 TRAP dicarboxylate transporter, DctM subunit, unknown substrate 3 [Candidatus Rhodobacter lobularis]
MSETLIGVIGIGALFFCLVARLPVGMSLLVVGFGGIWWLDGSRAAIATMSSETYSSVTAYGLSIIPLFVLMGNVAGAAGYSQKLYEAAYAWIGRLRGGLGAATVMGCAAFAAVSGSSVATAVTIGKVALPQMKRFGYADGLATGSVAAGGTLGILIPPSTGFVLYAILTEESIGKLFIAGILPGLLLSLLFVVVIVIVTTLNPEQGPAGPTTTWGEKLWSTLMSMPLIGVILVSIGGIYLGVFTPVEAAGVGAFLVTVLALGTGAMKISKMPDILMETVVMTAMLYLIIIGAHVFGPFLALTHIPATLAEGLQSLGLGAYGTLLLILIGYIILGMFFDGLAMLVVTMPVVYPIITAFGFDPIWFGVVCVIVIEMGLITPPVGINVFVVKGVAQGVPMATIFRGVLPFWFAMAVCLLLLVLFPQIATFLPTQMKG